jgi:hypothetical protein
MLGLGALAVKISGGRASFRGGRRRALAPIAAYADARTRELSMRTSALAVSSLATVLFVTALASAQEAAPDPEATAARLEERLRVLQQGTSSLYADVGESYRRLAAIRMDLFENVDGARVTIAHDDRVGALYRLVEVTYAIDGEAVFHRRDESGALDRDLDVFDGSVEPGDHTLSVVLRYVGNGNELVQYLSGYRFVVRSSHSFVAPPGQHTRISVRAFERSIDVPYEQRLGLEYDRNVAPLSPSDEDRRMR